MALKLTAAHLGELAAELAPLVSGLRVHDVQPLPPRDVLLVLERPPAEDGRTRVLRLRLSADSGASRAHLVFQRIERAQARSFGPFYERLATELVDSRLRDVTQVRGDRILRLTFRGNDPRSKRYLIAELTGRHANLVLLDGQDRVLSMLVPPPSGKTGPRLVEGEDWQPPPGVAGGASGAADTTPLAELLGDLPEPERPLPVEAPLSRGIETVLGGEAEEFQRARLAKDLSTRVKRRLKKARALVRGLAERRAAADAAPALLEEAELLKSHQHLLRRGLETVEVPDYFAEGSPPRSIAIDPKRGPAENVKRLFDRYHKLVRSFESLDREEQLATRRAEDLEQLLERAREPLRSGADLEQLEREAVAAGLLDARQEARPPARRPKRAARLPYHVFRGLRGSEIRVGRSARDNDTLTLRHARGGDLWLHTADAPGSHVVLKLARGSEPDPEELLDAAHLAVHFSPLRRAGRADVHVAHQKFVRKPKGAKPGLVTLSGGRVLTVRVEPARLKRLLNPARAAAERPGDPDGASPRDTSGPREPRS